MIAAGNKRISSLMSLQLVITGLVVVTIAGCRSTTQSPQATQTSQAAGPAKGMFLVPTGPGSETPIVISGGSLHFRARGQRNAWDPCDGTHHPTAHTTCYMATFNHSDKATLNNYQFLNSSFGLDPKQVDTGWEVDVVDINPGNQPTLPMQDGVRVCAESSNPFTSCNLGSFTSDSIYVIAVGGTFDIPTSAHPRKLVYHDVVGTTDYDSINDIRLNVSVASPLGAKDEVCTTEDNYCALFLSRSPPPK